MRFEEKLKKEEEQYELLEIETEEYGKSEETFSTLLLTIILGLLLNIIANYLYDWKLKTVLVEDKKFSYVFLGGTLVLTVYIAFVWIKYTMRYFRTIKKSQKQIKKILKLLDDEHKRLNKTRKHTK